MTVKRFAMNTFKGPLVGGLLSLSLLAWPVGASAFALRRPAPMHAPASALRWSAPVPATYRPPFAQTGSPTGVSCPSGRLCVAVDAAGNVLTATHPTAGLGAWRVVHVSPGLPGYQVPSQNFPAISCPSLRLCVEVDNEGVVTSTHPTGGAAAWRRVGLDGEHRMVGVSCPSAHFCVAVDDYGNVLTSTHPAGGSRAWTLRRVDRANGGFGAVSCPLARFCAAVDYNGNVFASSHPGGGRRAWSVRRVDRSRAGLTGISCPSARLCVAADGNVNAFTSTHPFGGRRAWTERRLDRSRDFPTASVSCSSAHLCVVVDQDGNSFTTAHPSARRGAWSRRGTDGSGGGFNAVSCPSVHLYVAMDDGANAVTTTHPADRRVPWAVVSTGDGENVLSAVSCPSGALCVAVGDVIATARDPTGPAGAWRLVQPPPNATAGLSVSCPSLSLCVAGGTYGDILTSTAPTSGKAWSGGRLLVPSGLGESDGAPISGVSCPTSGLCVGVGNSYSCTHVSAGRGESGTSCGTPDTVLVSSKPADGAKSWRTAPFRTAGDGLPYVGGLTGVSCPSASLCVAVGSGVIAVSTNPSRDLKAWRELRLPDPHDPYGEKVDNLTAVSCPSERLCVAVDDRGNVLTSTDPTGGPRTWAKRHVDRRGGRLTAVSCPSASLCVAVDVHGNALASTEPARPGTWIANYVDRGADHITGRQTSLTGVSCPSLSLCVVVDSAGNVVTGSAPATG